MKKIVGLIVLPGLFLFFRWLMWVCLKIAGICGTYLNIPTFLPNISVFMADMMINHMILGVQF